MKYYYFVTTETRTENGETFYFDAVLKISSSENLAVIFKKYYCVFICETKKQAETLAKRNNEIYKSNNKFYF